MPYIINKLYIFLMSYLFLHIYIKHTMLVSFDIQSIRQDQRQLKNAKSDLFLVEPDILDIKTLTLKAPIMTAADSIHKYFFIVFQRK